MAKVKIQGNASGTGVLTVTAPNTSTDRTLTLPDSTATLATTDINSFTGDTTITSGDIVFATAGKGICLGVTSNTDANTLDDYEEGTWTPVVKDDAGNTSPSITHNYSTYTKIGRMVTLTTELSSISSSGLTTTGDVRVYGLPFAVTTFGIGAVNMENVDYKDSYTDTESVTTIAANTYVYFRVNRNNGGSQGLEGGDLNSGSSGFSFTVTYFV
jgi:hypothetical protein